MAAVLIFRYTFVNGAAALLIFRFAQKRRPLSQPTKGKTVLDVYSYLPEEQEISSLLSPQCSTPSHQFPRETHAERSLHHLRLSFLHFPYANK